MPIKSLCIIVCKDIQKQWSAGVCIKVKGPVCHELEKSLNSGTWSVRGMDRVFGMTSHL